MPDTHFDLTLAREFSIRSNETDISGNIRPGALANLLIQSAIDSADHLGFGLASLREEKFFWVLSRLMFHIDRPIRWRETIIIETWPRDIDGLHYLRDFRVLDCNGKAIGYALSGWLLLDVHSKRPKRLSEERREVFTRLHDKHAGNPEDLKRLVAQKQTSFDERTIESNYFDFDLNGHVTTTRYIDWMMDSFTFDFHRKHFLSTLYINFVKELLPDDAISLAKWDDDPDYHFEGTSVVSGAASFLASAHFIDYKS